MLMLLTSNPFAFNLSYTVNNYAFKTVSTLLLVYALYIASRKLFGLRFLNIKKHVENNQKFNFIDDFKGFLEQLSYVTTANELIHVSQHFFHKAFGVPVKHVSLHIRGPELEELEDNAKKKNYIASITENFIINTLYQNEELLDFFRKTKIIIKDEIAFSNFYEPNDVYQACLVFCNQIQADIFLPILQDDRIIGYIIVKEESRPNAPYNDTERDEMLVFARYLGNIIHLLRHRNLDALIAREKSLLEELYHKHQEVNHYKESIRYFFRTSKERSIGIIFYKSSKFVRANQAAHQILEVDPNYHQGHPITQQLKSLAHDVEQYRTQQSRQLHDYHDQKIILSAFPSLEKNSVIITAYYPEISETIKPQFDFLKNPSQWDYLLYLETTQAGKIINQHIPGTGETLLDMKLHILKSALTKKAMLLAAPEEDLSTTVDMLHKISLKQSLYTLDLQQQERRDSIAIQLFGLNPLFEGMNSYQSLLEKLDETGTLYIKNIHFLSLETQKRLYTYIKYGYFYVFKSEQSITSNVRIICSTNRNLFNLVEEGTFVKELYEELQKDILHIKPLFDLPKQEFVSLANGITTQSIKRESLQNFLTLDDETNVQLYNAYPSSFYELRKRIQKLLTKNSKVNKLSSESVVRDTNENDVRITRAAKLGKQALKEKDLMVFLWDTFQSQTKIATLLGVNRSSVNRRYRQYNIIDE
jgi:transcriptional regulator of acetoin/glycerol metabolism